MTPVLFLVSVLERVGDARPCGEGWRSGLVLWSGLLLLTVTLVPPAPLAASPTERTVRGTLVPIGTDDLGRLRVVVTASDDTSAVVTSAREFAVPIDTDDRNVRVLVDAADGRERAFHPALFEASVRALERGMAIPMIPFQWRIQRGAYAGDTVAISMQEALFAPKQALPPYLDGEIRDELYRAAPARWDPERRPVPVVIRNATPNARPLPAKDSLWIWNALEETEEVFGRDLFRPAREEGRDWTDLKRPPDGILGVVVDTVGGRHECTGGGYRRGEAVWSWPPTLAKIWQEPPPAGYTEEGTRIQSALNIYCHHLFEDRSESAVVSTLQHEILHALGFGHGCLIPSHMAYRCEPETESIRTFNISPYDVAYWELREAVFDAVEAHDTELGFLPALFGERAVVRGRRPIPSPRDWERRVLPVPPAPEHLTARVVGAESGGPRVEIDWTGDFRIDSRSYRVYRSREPLDGTPDQYTPLDTLEAWSVRGRSAYVDRGVEAGTVYYYRITAFYADHPTESAFSAELEVAVPRPDADSAGGAGAPE